jgi:nitric oxide reductase NorD protein
MSEPEELLADAARHATVFARDLWRRHRGRAENDRRIGLADIAPRLDLLLTAVFGEGRRIRVAQLPPPTTLLRQSFGAERGPHAKHAVPATDDTSIWLPAELGLAADDELASRLYRAMALAQATRALRGAATQLDAPRAGLFADLYLLLEAYAADEALGAMLPGIAASIDLLRQISLERRPPVDAFPPRRQPVERLVRELLESRCGRPIAPALVAASPSASRALAERLAAEIAASAGTLRFGSEPLLKDWWTGALRAPAAADGPTLVPGSVGELDGDEGREPKSARLRRTPERRDAVDGEDDDRDDPGLVAIQNDDPHPHAEDPMGLRRPVDRDEEANAEQLGDMVADLPEARTIATPAPAKEVLLSDDPPDAQAKLALDDAKASETCVRYPEWDYRRAAYRHPGAGVRPSIAPAGSDSWVDEKLAEHAAMLGTVRRRFEMLRARRVRLRRQRDGDDIDLDACIEHHADLAAGQRSAEGLYELRRAGDRDLAVLLLIDVSGSTDSWVEADRRVIDVEREALLIVSVALQGLGEPFAIEAFSGEGPEHVSLRTVKHFDEPYGRDVARRIAGLEPERYTRAGAAIRHATALLMRRRAEHRLLLLLSDGKPNDVDEYEGRYGAEDMRQAVVEAKLQGIFPFCLTIDRHAASYLPRVFGAHQYALLKEPERLPEVLVEWMKRLIAA